MAADLGQCLILNFQCELMLPGRQVALDHFDRPIMAKQLAELFIDVVGVP